MLYEVITMAIFIITVSISLFLRSSIFYPSIVYHMNLHFVIQVLFLLLIMIQLVITSYSIHYAKLYEITKIETGLYFVIKFLNETGLLINYKMKLAFIWIQGSWKWTQWKILQDVITSYSIHYTKLYDKLCVMQWEWFCIEVIILYCFNSEYPAWTYEWL